MTKSLPTVTTAKLNQPQLPTGSESGGTTGAPKRVVLLRDWHERSTAWMSSQLDAHGVPRNVNWLCVMPTGPHAVGMLIAEQARRRGGLLFTVDMDPRWVKKLIAAGKADEATAYAEHLVEQAGYLLRSQDIGVLMTTPPLLERIAGHDDLVLQGYILSRCVIGAGESVLPGSRAPVIVGRAVVGWLPGTGGRAGGVAGG